MKVYAVRRTEKATVSQCGRGARMKVAVGVGVLFAVDVVFGDGGGGVESGAGRQKRVKVSEGKSAATGRVTMGAWEGADCARASAATGRRPRRRRVRAGIVEVHFFVRGGIIHNVSFLQIGGEGVFLGGGVRILWGETVLTGAGRIVCRSGVQPPTGTRADPR